MAEFTAITTQEEFDERIKERLAREAKKYEAYTAPDALKKLQEDYEKQIAGLQRSLNEAAEKAAKHDNEIAERDAKIKGYETDSVKTRIAHEMGLTYDAIKFLQGEDEEAIKTSAESLKSLMGNNAAPPLASTEGAHGSSIDAAYKTMLAGLSMGQ